MPPGTEGHAAKGKLSDAPTPAPVVFPPAHGGNRQEAAEWAGMDPETILDFSVNVHPLGPPDCVWDLLQHPGEALQNYPDPYSKRLKRALARHGDCREDEIIAGNGSTEIIFILPRIWPPGKSVVLVCPCFSEYERAFRSAGIPVHTHCLPPDQEFQVQPQELIQFLEGIPDCGGIVIGHPMTPSGTLWPAAVLDALEGYCQSGNLLLVIDETFIDFAPQAHSLGDRIRDNGNLLILRSLSKFYALPGLRVGYAAASAQRVNQLEAFLPPWSVNGLAQQIGEKIVEDADYGETIRHFIDGERESLIKRLKGLPELRVYQSATNFILFRVPGLMPERAFRMYRGMLENAILVRNCANFRGLDASFFRVSVKTRPDNDLLIHCLKNWFSNDSSGKV